MKKKLLLVAITGILMACGNGSERSASTDSTAISTTPPPTADSTSTMGTMMGDTTRQVESDSTVKSNQ
jgi:hypothetical protein